MHQLSGSAVPIRGVAGLWLRPAPQQARPDPSQKPCMCSRRPRAGYGSQATRTASLRWSRRGLSANTGTEVCKGRGRGTSSPCPEVEKECNSKAGGEAQTQKCEAETGEGVATWVPACGKLSLSLPRGEKVLAGVAPGYASAKRLCRTYKPAVRRQLKMTGLWSIRGGAVASSLSSSPRAKRCWRV